MVSEKEHIDELVAAYKKGFDKGYDIGFLDGKEESLSEFVPKRWEV